LNVADPDGLATQVAILVEGAIIAALVRGDSGMARAAKEAARVLLTAAGLPDPERPKPRKPRAGSLSPAAAKSGNGRAGKSR
jgi:hypothetical protein